MDVFIAHADGSEARKISRHVYERFSIRSKIFTCGLEAWAAARLAKYRCFIINASLPNKTGYQLIRSIREQDEVVPIILLVKTQYDAIRIEGYQAGADSVMSTPYNTDILLAQMDVLLKRSTPARLENTIPICGYSFDTVQNMLLQGDTVIFRLTGRQSEVFQYFLRATNRVVRRQDILKSIWRKDDYFNGRSMDVVIHHLRVKLAKTKNLSIETLHTIGFRLFCSADAGAPAQKQTS